MANNFDLRQFLTENKLTKNTQLLSEGKFSDSYDSPASKKVHSQLRSIVDIFEKSYDEEIGELDAAIAAAEEETGTQVTPVERRVLQQQAQWIRTHDTEMEREGVGVDGEEDYEDDDERANDIEQAQHNIERRYEEGVEEGKSYKVSKNSKEAQHLKKGDIIGSGDEVVSISAGAKTPSGKVEVTLKTKDGKTKTSTWGKTTKVGVKEKETVKENTMTERDKYLTRLVENALGLQVTEDDNVDYTMGHQDDPNQLPNPAPELNIPEGEEMVNEKPLPKYENIEKLMQEIDKSTDEAAHKYKMEEMKRVADMLEKKCTALEEGDDADHIDQKKLKQMKKDIMTLRKGMEKLEKLGEKKFAKKETKAELKEGFDLRNFLVENKLTSNSRMLNELATAEDHIDRAAANQAIGKLNSMGARIDAMKGAELMKKLEATPYSQMFQVMAQYFEDHNALEKVKQYMAGEGYPV